MAQEFTRAEVPGMDQFRKDMRKLGKEYRRDLDKVLRKAGAPIAVDAKDRYRALHPRRRGGSASQRGIRAGLSRGHPKLILNAATYPYLLGQEFGGSQPQFPPHDSSGLFFWPSITAGADDAFEAILRAIDKANHREFPRR